jgi:hypothetical protein
MYTYVKASQATGVRTLRETPYLLEIFRVYSPARKSRLPDRPLKFPDVIVESLVHPLHVAGATDNSARRDHASLTDFFERKDGKMVGDIWKTVIFEDALGGCDKIAGVL